MSVYPTHPSSLITGFIDEVVTLWSDGGTPDECIMLLEDRLKEVSFSKFVLLSDVTSLCSAGGS